MEAKLCHLGHSEGSCFTHVNKILHYVQDDTTNHNSYFFVATREIWVVRHYPFILYVTKAGMEACHYNCMVIKLNQFYKAGLLGRLPWHYIPHTLIIQHQVQQKSASVTARQSIPCLLILTLNKCGTYTKFV